MKKYFLYLSGLLLLGSCFCVQAQSVAIVAESDNTLIEIVAPDTFSNGSGPYFFAGRTGQAVGSYRRGLLKFDVAGNVQTAAIIDSVSLSLHLGQAPNTNSVALAFHAVTKPWGEGTSYSTGGMGDSVEVGDVTWVHSSYPTQYWDSVGGDFEQAASQGFVVGDTGFYQFESVSAGLLADVQSWAVSPASNFGWIVIGTDTTPSSTKRFDSREHPIPVNRPTLTVFYHFPNAVVEETKSIFRVSPNPCSNQLRIEIDKSQDNMRSALVRDLLGRYIATPMIALDGQIMLDCSGWSNGLHFISVELDDLDILTLPVLKN